MALSSLLAVGAEAKPATADELRLALESAGAVAWSVDLLTGEVHTAGSCGQLVGGPEVRPSSASVDPEGFLARVHPDDRDAVATIPERVVGTGGSFVEDFRLCWPAGTMRWVTTRGRVVTDPEGRPVALSGVLLDVTKGKEAEQELAALYDAERLARAEAQQAMRTAEARGQRLAQLERVTEAGLAHLSVDKLLVELLERVQSALNIDVVVVCLQTPEGELAVRAAVGVDGLPVGVVDPGDDPQLVPMRAGTEPLVLEDIDETSCPIPHFRGQGLRSLVEVSLMVAGRTTGVLQIGARSGQRFSASDVHLLQLTADRMALAIDRVQLYEREHSAAETLQRSLLPDKLPDLPEADMAGIYRPGAAATVGGDWYDVIPLPKGEVALVMGDVVGSGVRAASIMGQLRGACRIYAGEGHDPADVVRNLNRYAFHLGTGEMATLVYLTLDPSTGRGVLVSAGHLPPLVRHADGRCEYLCREPNLPLGVKATARYAAHPVELPPDSTVLLYTDGLMERRDSSLEVGFERLAEAMAAAPAAPGAACDHILHALLGDEQPQDDVALLAVSRTNVMTRELDLRLPAEATALPHLRRVLRNWLEQMGANDEETYDLVLAVSEAAANVSEHAYGPVEAQYQFNATADEGHVRLVVKDFGQWRAPRGSNRGRGLLLMNALTHDVAIHHSEEGTEVRLGRRLSNPTPAAKEKVLAHD